MSHKNKNAVRIILFYLLTFGIALIVVIPFFWMVSTSLKSKGAIMQIPIEWIPQNPTLNSYKTVFTRFPLVQAIINSFGITIAYTVITILSASMAAFAITKIKFPYADIIFKLFLASMMVPTQVTLIPLFVIMNKLGLINTYPSVILPSLFRAFAVFLLVQQMRGIPNDFMEAAKIDGAGMFRIYAIIIMPLTKSAIATLTITTFMEWPLLMLSDKTKMTLTLALNSLNGQYGTEYNLLMAGSLISMLPIMCIYAFAQKYFKAGLMSGGVKG